MPKATTRPRLSASEAAYRSAVRRICADNGETVNRGLIRYTDDLVRIERRLRGNGSVEEAIYRTDGEGTDTVIFQVIGMRVREHSHDPTIARHLYRIITEGTDHE